MTLAYLPLLCSVTFVSSIVPCKCRHAGDKGFLSCIRNSGSFRKIKAKMCTNDVLKAKPKGLFIALVTYPICPLLLHKFFVPRNISYVRENKILSLTVVYKF